jgi:hypothetical protein
VGEVLDGRVPGMDRVERPVIFQPWGVRAILEGRKTRTRRLILPQPTDLADERRRLSVLADCPYGLAGMSTLWVRETWALRGCGARVPLNPEAWPSGWPVGRLQYPATDEAPVRDSKGKPYWWNNRPSNHMPRWACRLLLTVLDVEVRRLQDIDEEEAEQEGVELAGDNDPRGDERNYVEGFRLAWDEINLRRGYGWDANPTVYAIEFAVKEVLR